MKVYKFGGTSVGSADRMKSVAQLITEDSEPKIVVLSAIACMGYYNVNDRKLMAQNIDSAISKGIDPISVRCSYASSTDTICVAFAASPASHNVSSQVSAKK